MEGVLEYHQELRKQVAAFLRADVPKTLPAFAARVDFKGTAAVSFERTVLDLALTNGSLGYIEPDVAYEISRTYTAQDKLQGLQDGFREATLSPTTFATLDAMGLAIAMEAYLGDVVVQEPRLLERYAVLTATPDNALGSVALEQVRGEEVSEAQ